MNPLLSAIEQAVLDQAKDLALEHVAPRAVDIDSSGRCPDELVQQLCARISDEVDGACPTPMHLALRLEQVARHSAAAAAVAAAHGVGSFIARDHTKPRTPVADASPIYAAVCGGTALSAEASDDGAVLQGTVDLALGAAYATVFVVACEQGSAAGVFVMSADTDGVSVGPTEVLMGLAGSGTASITWTGVRLTPSARVGDLGLASRLVDATRIAHAAQALGIAAGALDAALTHLASADTAEDIREQPQSTQWMLADIATESEAARLSLWHAALELGNGDAHAAAAMCRLLAAEAAVASSRRAIQIAGEQGTLRTSVFERLYRDAKVMEVLGGTNEDQLGIIADGLLPNVSR